jgi:hypothetical protein
MNNQDKIRKKKMPPYSLVLLGMLLIIMVLSVELSSAWKLFGFILGMVLFGFNFVRCLVWETYE